MVSSNLKQIILSILMATIIGLSITISCQDKQTRKLKTEINKTKTENENCLKELKRKLQLEKFISENIKDDDEKTKTAVNKIIKATRSHDERVLEIEKASKGEATENWLKSDVPDSIRKLFNSPAAGNCDIRSDKTAGDTTRTLQGTNIEY